MTGFGFSIIQSFYITEPLSEDFSLIARPASFISVCREFRSFIYSQWLDI